MKRFVLLASMLLFTAVAQTSTDKPNILVIWGDDIGQDNISAYHRGLLSNRTPNIDRIANEGALFTDMYAQQLESMKEFPPARGSSLSLGKLLENITFAADGQ